MKPLLTEAKNTSDHEKNPYHNILTKHGYKHKETVEKPGTGSFASAGYTQHSYERDDKNKVHVWSWHSGEKPVWHGRHTQSNGIVAPSHGETKPQLDKTLTRKHSIQEEIKVMQSTKELIESILAKKYNLAEEYAERILLQKAVKKLEETKETVAKNFFESTRNIDEETEQLDELSKTTVGRYIGKANHSVHMNAFDQGNLSGLPGGKKRGDTKAAFNKVIKRSSGIDRAVKKLTGKAKVAAT